MRPYQYIRLTAGRARPIWLASVGECGFDGNGLSFMRLLTRQSVTASLGILGFSACMLGKWETLISGVGLSDINYRVDGRQ